MAAAASVAAARPAAVDHVWPIATGATQPQPASHKRMCLERCFVMIGWYLELIGTLVALVQSCYLLKVMDDVI